MLIYRENILWPLSVYFSLNTLQGLTRPWLLDCVDAKVWIIQYSKGIYAQLAVIKNINLY